MSEESKERLANSESEQLRLENQYENYWEILRYNHEMIRFSELKAGLVISISGVLFSILFQSIDSVKPYFMDSILNLIVAGIFVLLTMISVMYSFRCFMPRFEIKNPTSMIFFGDIVSDFPNFKDYHKFAQKTLGDEYEFSLQLAEQIHTNATIATRKFAAVSKAMRYMLWSIVCLIAMVCIMYLG
jgi:hypothetical protein